MKSKGQVWVETTLHRLAEELGYPTPDAVAARNLENTGNVTREYVRLRTLQTPEWRQRTGLTFGIPHCRKSGIVVPQYPAVWKSECCIAGAGSREG